MQTVMDLFHVTTSPTERDDVPVDLWGRPVRNGVRGQLSQPSAAPAVSWHTSG